MTGKALAHRLATVRSRVPVGYPGCRDGPPLTILGPEDPIPSASCAACGRANTGTTRVRFTELDRGPA